MKNVDNYIKARKYADNLIQKAKKERDERGHRENLGYDSIYKLEEMDTFNILHYTEQCHLRQYFSNECDKI